MKILLVLGSIVIPILMVYGKNRVSYLQSIYHLLALITLLLFSNIASLSVYKIIINNRVFMTDIHGVFLNPVFLISGAYLGVYTLFFLLESLIVSLGKNKSNK